MTLSEYIKEFRENNGLSQRQLADMADLSNAYISMLEKNMNPRTGQPVRPSMPAMRKLARAMGIPVTRLMSSVDELAVDMPATVVDYEKADDTLRMLLSEEEYAMLTLFRGADERSRQDAAALLRRHCPS